MRFVAALALVAGVGGLLVGGSRTAAEAVPEPCGYVRYGPEGGPTSTVPGVTYCDEDLNCDGPGVYQPPAGDDEAQVEAYVCAKHLLP